jgi:hypothetical protein
MEKPRKNSLPISEAVKVDKADILLVRFDGLELDSGTVLVYMMVKYLGKPTVVLCGNFRSVTFLPKVEPYNLIVQN